MKELIFGQRALLKNHNKIVVIMMQRPDNKKVICEYKYKDFLDKDESSLLETNIRNLIFDKDKAIKHIEEQAQGKDKDNNAIILITNEMLSLESFIERDNRTILKLEDDINNLLKKEVDSTSNNRCQDRINKEKGLKRCKKRLKKHQKELSILQTKKEDILKEYSDILKQINKHLVKQEN